MTTQIPYNTAYFPPIPALHIQFRVPDTNRQHGPVQAVVDTGADMTLVPRAWLELIAAPEADEVRMRSHWGEPFDATTYLVDIELGNVTLPGIEVVGDPYGTEVLLGRNVLNILILLLDGPARTTDTLANRPRQLHTL